MKKLGSYKNGNHITTIYEDGTRQRATINPKDDFFTYDFAENFDCKITDKCNGGCPMCHENSTPDGKHADILNMKIFDTLMPYTEIAIGGGNILEHPDILEFLKRLHEKNVIANITINQRHLQQFKDLIFKIKPYVYGIGVSLSDSSNDEDFKIIDELGDNVVIHTINGVLTEKDFGRLHNRKVLILGYKNFRRGVSYFSKVHDEIIKNMEMLKDKIVTASGDFKLVSFDNLAIDQIDVRKTFKLSDKTWNLFFQGKENTSTFFLDAVTMTTAKTSTCPIELRKKINNNTTIEEAFKLSQEIEWTPIVGEAE